MCEETVLFTPVPECEDLCRFLCKLNDVININGFPMSFYHSQIYICRFTLATFPEIIAAPVPGTEDHIEIITRKDYCQTKKLQIFLKNENVWSSDPQPVNLENYRECVIYTIKFKLSPSWNRLGRYLCQGNDFLTANEDINAVQFDVIIKKLGMFLKFKSIKLKVSPLKLQDLQLSSSLLTEFKQNPEGVIVLGQCWSNVLPSAFKARLLSVSKQIPKMCLFKNYQELRIYWKNMYGYILPESSEGILYYQVCFRAFPDAVFMYPDICLESEAPKIINYKNHAPTCIQFVEGLNNNVYSICGKTLSFVKSNLNEFKAIPNFGFIPAREIKTEKIKSEIVSLPSMFGNIKSCDPKVVHRKLKQQTLNFPKRETTTEELPMKSLENSNLIMTSPQNEGIVSKIKSPELSVKNLSQYTQSRPINRKLINDLKFEDENISQKSETYKSFLNLIKYNETPEKRKHPKEKQLLDVLLQEKSDIAAFKVSSPPTKRVRIFKQNSAPPLESVSKYFKEQKSIFNKPLKTEDNRLHFQNLLKKN